MKAPERLLMRLRNDEDAWIVQESRGRYALVKRGLIGDFVCVDVFDGTTVWKAAVLKAVKVDRTQLARLDRITGMPPRQKYEPKSVTRLHETGWLIRKVTAS